MLAEAPSRFFPVAKRSAGAKGVGGMFVNRSVRKTFEERTLAKLGLRGRGGGERTLSRIACAGELFPLLR